MAWWDSWFDLYKLFKYAIGGAPIPVDRLAGRGVSTGPIFDIRSDWSGDAPEGITISFSFLVNEDP